mgnify:CR=1 FL=1
MIYQINYVHKFIFFLNKINFLVNNTNGDKMTKEEYKKLTKQYSPKENKLKKAVIAFVIGGLVGVIGQFLVELYMEIGNLSYNSATSYMMVTLIFLACLFTAIGFFDTWVMKAGAGLFVPITGFAHATTSSAIDYKHEGLVFGIGSNIFKLSGSVILYGVVSAYVFGIIRYLFFGG